MRRSRPLLGTFVEIAILDATDDASMADAVDAAFDAVSKVGRLMSFHDAGSELSAINAAAAGTVIAVDPWSVDVLRIAHDLFVATAGAFDCGIGDVLVAQGDLPAHGNARQAASTRPGSLSDVEVIDDRHVLIHRPVCLDFGGIAKGFAVDKAVEALAAAGVSTAVVNAGGDLRVLGAAPQPIHLQPAGEAQAPRYLGAMADGALGTSTAGPAPGKCRGGLVDPFTRRRLAGSGSFTVIAPTCAVADGLTKALAVAGALDAACLQRYGATPVVA